MEKTCDEVKIVEGFRRSAWQIVTNRQRIERIVRSLLLEIP